MTPIMLNSYLSASLMEPPDLILSIGSINFLGHSYLLSNFSEVLKAACKDCSPVENGMKKIIQLNNISPDFISHILYYIYTGYLNLNEDNVLGILLVCHSLKIPKIVQICNDFLLKNQSYQYNGNHTYNLPNTTYKETTQNIIRPVANKPKPVNTAIEGPLTTTVWLPSSSTTFKPLKARGNWTDMSCYLPIIPDKTNKCNGEDATHSQKSNRSKESINIDKETCHPTTIIDIANCDGPVRFTKILNAAYNTSKLSSSYNDLKVIDSSKTSKKETDTSELDARSNCSHSQSLNRSNKCVHCNQTFKSKYCFQKHKLRHINNIEVSKKIMLAEQTQKSNTIKRKNRHYKRGVKPLDMNVQYYPCKTCGVKFPSYYFVHKHRKLCHSDEEN